MDGEMPGSFPGRPGGERDEPLLDMIFEQRPLPPGAPPEMHDLARLLGAAAGPAEAEELAGQAAALAAFTRLAPPPGTSPAAQRSARRWLSGRPPRGRLSLAAALVVAAAGLGSTAAAFADVLPGPIQHFAHSTIAAPDRSRAAPQQKVAAAPPRRSARPRTGPSVSHEAHPHTSAQARGHVGRPGRKRRGSRWHGRWHGHRPVNPACAPGPVPTQSEYEPGPANIPPGHDKGPGNIPPGQEKKADRFAGPVGPC
jgi:hypothetical protein